MWSVGERRNTIKASAALLLSMAILCCLCIFSTIPVHASTRIATGTNLSTLPEGEYDMDFGDYYLDRDMSGEYEFNVLSGMSVKVYMHGHVIDGGQKGEDIFHVEEGGSLELIGVTDDPERSSTHEGAKVHIWERAFFKGWYYDYQEDKDVTGAAIINFEHGVHLENNARLKTSDLTIAGSKLSGVMIDGGSSTVNLKDSTITYNSRQGTGGILIDGDNNTVSLEKAVLSENRNANSDKGGNIRIIGDGNKIQGDPNATGDERSCLKSGEANVYGGAIYVKGNNCKIANLLVKDNNSRREGGAFYIDGDEANIHGIEFDNNNAFWELVDFVPFDDEYEYDASDAYGERGGAICLYGKNGRIYNCKFTNNATIGEDADEGGGAIFLDGSGHEIDNCIFEGNKLRMPCSYEDDPWEGLYGGAINIQSKNTSIKNSKIRGSFAGYKGGAVFSDAVGTCIENCIIEDNVAYYDDSEGGGICFNESDTLVKNCTIKRNSAGERWDRGGLGGGIYFEEDNNLIVDTTIENNASGYNFGKGVYVNNEDLTLQGKVIIRNNSNESGSQWSNLYLHKSTELSVTCGRLDKGSEVWVDSKWGRENDPTDGYIYHESKDVAINRYAFYSDRLGYSFIEKNGTLYYTAGADYAEVEVAAPSLSIQPKSEGESWSKYPGKVYINTDPCYEFSKRDKHYEITRTLPGGSPEQVEYQTDKKGDYVDLEGKDYTYTLSLNNTVTIDTPGGEQVLGTSATTTAEYVLSIPYERSAVSVQVCPEDEENFEEIGRYSAGDEVTANTHTRISPVGKEPYSWTLEYHKANTAEGTTTTIDFDAVYDKRTKTATFTLPEDVDGGVTKLRRVNGTARYKMTYKAYPAACASLLPHKPDQPDDHVVIDNYETMLEIKPIDGEVDGTMYYTEEIILDGKALPIDGKTVKIIEDHEIQYVFTTTEPKRSCEVTYDLTGTGLDSSSSRIVGTETYTTGETFLEKHDDDARANIADYYGSSLMIDHFQVGVADDSGGMKFSEDNVLGLDDPVTDDMTLRVIVTQAYRGQTSNQRGCYFKPDGDDETYTNSYVAGDSINVGIKEEYKNSEYRNKVVDYWQVTRLNYVNAGYPREISTDLVKADGQAVKQNQDAEQEAYYKVSENSITVPLTKDMDHPDDINKLITVSVVPVFKDPITNITGAPDTMTVGDTWDPEETTKVWPESIKDSTVIWKVIDSSGRKELAGEFEPATPGKYTVEATVKDGLGLTKDYTQTFDIKVKGTTEYKVSFDANAGDAVDPPLDQYVTEGEMAEKPDDLTWEGHVFGGWFVTVDGEEVPYDFNAPVVSDVDLKAHWSGLYDVTAAVKPDGEGAAHGEVAITGETVGDKYVGGSEVILTAAPEEGYEVKAWTDNDSVVEGNTTEVYTISGLDADHEVSVEFKAAEAPVTKHRVTVHTGAYSDKGTILGEGEYAPGEAVTLEAVPDDGYVSIIGWNKALYIGQYLPGGFITSSNPYIFAMGDEDVDLLVWFDKEISDIELTSATEIEAGSEYTPTVNVYPSGRDRTYCTDDKPIWEMVSGPDGVECTDPGKDFKVTNAGTKGGTIVLRATLKYEFGGELLYSYSQEYAIKVKSASEETFSVDFMDGALLVASKSVAPGAKVADIGRISRAGYRFDGWYSGGTQYNFDDPVSENLTLKAKWTEAEFIKSTVNCTSAGIEEHYKIGSGEGAKYYSDQYMQNEVTLESLSRTALGHKYGNPKYTWTSSNSQVTGKVVCERCKNTLTKIAKGEDVSETVKSATCTVPEKIIHTAEFKGEDAELFGTAEKTEDGAPALGHDWGEPSYEWSKDNTKVTAARSCRRDGCDAKESETALTTYEVLEEPTAEKEGLMRYTTYAFKNTAFEVQTKDVPISNEAEKEAAEKAAKDAAMAVGAEHVIGGSRYRVTSTGGRTVSFVKAASKKSVTVPATVKIAGETFKVTVIESYAFKGSNAKSVTVGANVSSIKKNAFKGSKVKTLTVKTKKLTKRKVKGSLKGSKVKTVKVKVGKKKVNKKYVKKYKKIFTKKNSGKKVKVK